MAPTEDANQTLTTNTPEPYPEQEPQHKSWWPLWLLGGLILLFLITIIILRGLCSDAWYINLLKLNDKLCGGTSSLEQQLNLKDGSISGAEIAEGAISLDQLSPSLQASVNNINNQLANPVAGPQGPQGFNGAKGNTGATGSAGPSEPCSIHNTFFCQGGNSYGTLAVLGTNDTQDLQVVAGGLKNTKFDTSGNLVVNRTKESTGFELAVDSLTSSNIFINQDQTIDSVITSSGPGILGGTNSNFLAVSDSVLTDVGGSTGVIFGSNVYGSLLNGSIVNTTINGLAGFTGGYWGGSVTNSQALNGMFLNTEVTNSGFIMGNFSEGVCLPIYSPCPPPIASIITGSNNILGMAESTAITSSDRVLISADDSTISFTNNSMVGVNSSAVDSVLNSLIFADNSNISDISGSIVNVRLFSDITNATASNIAGATIDFDGIAASTITGFGSTATNVGAFYGNLAYSNVINIEGSSAFLNQSNLLDVFGLYGFTGWTDLNNVTYVAGKFEGVDMDSSAVIVGEYGYTACDPTLGCPLAIEFDIDNSSRIFGSARHTNIYDSAGLFAYTDSTDPSLLISTLDGVSTSTIVGNDVQINTTSYSQVFGNSNTITGLNYAVLFGNNVSLDATLDPTYDYSYLGADSTGNINTRINNKGDDSWFNLSGGDFGIGTNTPNNKLDVTDISDDTPASFTGTSGTCTVDTFGGGWSCVSDENLKTNILSITGGLETVLALNGVTYNWKNDSSQTAVSGFIAQEVQKILPNLVSTLDDGTLTLNKDGMLPYIIEAIKEQDGKLEGINTQIFSQGIKIESLAGELKELADRVDNLEQEFENYKRDTDARIRELERRTGGSLDSLPVEPGAQPVPVN